MSKEKKYDIDNFFVGELYVSYKFGNLLEIVASKGKNLTKEELEERRKIYSLIEKGAVPNIGSVYNSYTDWSKRRTYQGVISIFYKNNNECISLHDGESYSNEGNDYYTNLIPLKELLPKVDYTTPKQMSMKEALSFFDILLKKSFISKIDGLYNKAKHPIQEFYVGSLNLYTGYLSGNNRSNMYQYCNLPQEYILKINGGKYLGFSRDSGFDKEGSLDSEVFDFDRYKCLFLKQQDGLYNINNHQMYNRGILENKAFDYQNYIESYYEYIIPFEEMLERNKEKKYSSIITIPESLKLFKKIK